MKRFFISIISLLVSVYSFGQFQNPSLNKIPSFKLTSPKGEVVDILELTRGKIAFINFWFIPCPPCIAEMGLLEKIHDRYKSDSNFIFISITASNPEAVKNLLSKSYEDTSMYSFFKQLSNLDTITFPIYYLTSCMDIVNKRSADTYDFKITAPEKINCPYDVFKFAAYPTTFIANKSGKILLGETGVLISKKDKKLNQVISLIDKSLKK